jgi:Trk-type K+ transport system membrane component
MVRATLYVGASALIWLAEGFMFSRFLAFSLWQTALLGVVYLALLGVSCLAILRAWRRQLEISSDLSAWKLLSLAPMVTTILGSFVSLPIVLAVLALGKFA